MSLVGPARIPQQGLHLASTVRTTRTRVVLRCVFRLRVTARWDRSTTRRRSPARLCQRGTTTRGLVWACTSCAREALTRQGLHLVARAVATARMLQQDLRVVHVVPRGHTATATDIVTAVGRDPTPLAVKAIAVAVLREHTLTTAHRLVCQCLLATTCLGQGMVRTMFACKPRYQAPSVATRTAWDARQASTTRGRAVRVCLRDTTCRWRARECTTLVKPGRFPWELRLRVGCVPWEQSRQWGLHRVVLAAQAPSRTAPGRVSAQFAARCLVVQATGLLATPPQER